jgi:hypothetical protein
MQGKIKGGSVRKNLLFLKKKKQKDFYDLARVLGVPARVPVIKVFWFFFSKKNRLLRA